MTVRGRNKCPHPKCEETKNWARYACPEHWRTLPLKIRDAIYKGFKLGFLSREWQEAHARAMKFWEELDATDETRG